MSLTRIHHLSISLDGFATGVPQSAEAPFGHAGERLHQWMFATQFWAAGEPPAWTMPSPSGTDPVSARRSWVRTSSARPAGRTTRGGPVGGVRTGRRRG